jgi:hypothetical protein
MTNRIKVTNRLQQVIGLNVWDSPARTTLRHLALRRRAVVELEGWQVSQDVSDKRAAGIISVEILPTQ